MNLKLEPPSTRLLSININHGLLPPLRTKSEYGKSPRIRKTESHSKLLTTLLKFPGTVSADTVAPHWHSTLLATNSMVDSLMAASAFGRSLSATDERNYIVH